MYYELRFFFAIRGVYDCTIRDQVGEAMRKFTADRVEMVSGCEDVRSGDGQTDKEFEAIVTVPRSSGTVPKQFAADFMQRVQAITMVGRAVQAKTLRA